MLKGPFVLLLAAARSHLGWVMPYYPAYQTFLLALLTAYLLYRFVEGAVRLRGPALTEAALDAALGAALLAALWLWSEGFIVYGDEKDWLRQALDFVNGPRGSMALSDSVMPLVFAPLLKAGGLPLLKTAIFGLLAGHFVIWRRLVARLAGAGFPLSAGLVFACAAVCMHCYPVTVSYMAFGYFLSSLALLLALYPPEDAWLLLPAVALLGLLFRQESVVLLPLALVRLLRLRPGPVRLLPVALAALLALPALYSSWRDELMMNSEKFDPGLVAGCLASGKEARYCYKPGLTANESYMLNVLAALSDRGGIPPGDLQELTRKLYEAPSPSLENLYYNLRFRPPWILALTAAAFAALAFLLFQPGPQRGPAAVLALAALPYFVLFYAQKYSVGGFGRFYFYLFPLYLCFLAAAWRRAAALLPGRRAIA